MVPPPEVDIASADRFAAELADALADRPSALEIDWTLVTFCDSSGLRELVNAAKHARAVGCRLTVRNPSRPLLRLADLLGASALLHLPPPPPLPPPASDDA